MVSDKTQYVQSDEHLRWKIAIRFEHFCTISFDALRRRSTPIWNTVCFPLKCTVLKTHVKQNQSVRYSLVKINLQKIHFTKHHSSLFTFFWHENQKTDGNKKMHSSKIWSVQSKTHLFYCNIPFENCIIISFVKQWKTFNRNIFLFATAPMPAFQ